MSQQSHGISCHCICSRPDLIRYKSINTNVRLYSRRRRLSIVKIHRAGTEPRVRSGDWLRGSFISNHTPTAIVNQTDFTSWTNNMNCQRTLAVLCTQFYVWILWMTVKDTCEEICWRVALWCVLLASIGAELESLFILGRNGEDFNLFNHP